MNIYYQKGRWKLIILGAAIVLAFIALWQINHIVQQLKKEEHEKVKLWASAIGKKADLVKYTEDFFKEIQEEEKYKAMIFLETQKNLLEQPLHAELKYTANFVLDNNTIPIIITDEFNNITVAQNVEIPDSMTVLSGKLLEEFSKNPPVTYSAYGICMKIYYRESKIYSDLRLVLNNVTKSFLSEVTDNLVFAPVVITDSAKTKIIASGNIDTSLFSTPEELEHTLGHMASENTPIEILLPNDQKAFIFYEKSSILKALQYYPLIYIFVAFVFALIAYNFFRSARSSEQNQIWVGMSKETAHQLGTPISSLLAWVEYMKIKGNCDDMALEIEKDIHRLETIAQRFSKIGSVPVLKPDNIGDILQNAVSYLTLRTSTKIKYNLILPPNEIIVPVNTYLFDWVIENLCKNAIDAMSGVGFLEIKLTEDNKKIYIDITDTGKGIPKSMFKTIFRPGFTTKQRGWGLGLSLSKRIINEYHDGKIFVKSSIVGKGTTFRIILKKTTK